MRKLTTTYSIDSCQDLKSSFGEGIEKELLSSLEKEVQEEIDKELLLRLMFEQVKMDVERNPSIVILYRDSDNPYIKEFVKEYLKKR